MEGVKLLRAMKVVLLFVMALEVCNKILWKYSH